VSLCLGLTLSVIGPTAPALAAHLRIHDADLGPVFTANFLAATMTTVASSPLYNRLGARTVYPLGIVLTAIGLYGEGAAATLPFLIFSAAVAGLGIGIVNVAGAVVATSLYPRHREAVLNASNVAFGAGAFLAPLLVGLALTHGGLYMPVYDAIALLLIVPLAPLVLGLAPAVHDSKGEIGQPSLRVLLGLRALYAPILIGFLYLGMEIGFAGWVVAIVQKSAHLSLPAATPAASAFWLLLALGGAPTVWGLRRGAAPQTFIVLGALATAAGAALLAAFGGNAAAALVCCGLVGLGMAPILPLALAIAVREVEAARPGATGVATSAVFTAGQLGAATIPALQGLLVPLGAAPALGLTCVSALGIAAAARRMATPRLADSPPQVR